MKADLIRKALEYARMLDVPIIEHPEDHSISAEGQVNEGFISYKYGLRGILKAAEEVIVARDLILQERIRSRLHLTHISTAGSVDLIRNAKKTKTPVTRRRHPAPPAAQRGAGPDLQHRVQGQAAAAHRSRPLGAGPRPAVTAPSTASPPTTPRTPATKRTRSSNTPPSASSAWKPLSPSICDRLVRTKLMTINRLVELFSTNPARVLGLKRQRPHQARIPGRPDHPQPEKALQDRGDRISAPRPTTARSSAGKAQGAIEYTIVSGNIVYRRK